MEVLELMNTYLIHFQEFYGQNKMKEKTRFPYVHLKTTSGRISAKGNEGPPLLPESKQAHNPVGARHRSCSAQAQPTQVCGAVGQSGALSRCSWEGACSLVSPSASGMNSPWRSRCMSTSMDARASSVKLLASRTSRKGSFWG